VSAASSIADPAESPDRGSINAASSSAAFPCVLRFNPPDPTWSTYVSAAQKHPERIDLLIADIVMPGMGGADLYAWLKSERPEMRVLFISGFMSREPLPGGFLKKPFSSATLIEKVREILEPQGSRVS
jgi:CheY-like chemotaxis protein